MLEVQKNKRVQKKEQNPDHSRHKARLSRIRGQVDGVERMIDERRYCPDIIFQIRAVSSALKSLEAEIMKDHMRGCVKSAFKAKDGFDAEKKIEEIMELIK